MANDRPHRQRPASAPKPIPNKVHQHREALGLTKVELARMAKLSDKTIARVERSEKGFRAVTYHRILNALNRERRTQGQVELKYDDLFAA